MQAAEAPGLIPSDVVSPEEIHRYISQIQKKRERNRQYYHEVTKVKKETQKQELERLRETCRQLQAQLTSTTDCRFADYEDRIDRLMQENGELKVRLEKLQAENTTLSTNLQIARQKNYELLMAKAEDILPKVRN